MYGKCHKVKHFYTGMLLVARKQDFATFNGYPEEAYSAEKYAGSANLYKGLVAQDFKFFIVDRIENKSIYILELDHHAALDETYGGVYVWPNETKVINSYPHRRKILDKMEMSKDYFLYMEYIPGAQFKRFDISNQSLVG